MNYHKFLFDGKKKTIRQKTDSANWTLREMIDGKLKQISFPTPNRSEAERMARSYLKARRYFSMEELRRRLQAQWKTPKCPATTVPVAITYTFPMQ